MHTLVLFFLLSTAVLHFSSLLFLSFISHPHFFHSLHPTTPPPSSCLLQTSLWSNLASLLWWNALSFSLALVCAAWSTVPLPPFSVSSRLFLLLLLHLPSTPSFSLTLEKSIACLSIRGHTAPWSKRPQLFNYQETLARPQSQSPHSLTLSLFPSPSLIHSSQHS